MIDAELTILKTIKNTMKPHGNIDLIEWTKDNCYVLNSPKGDTVNLNLTPYFKEPYIEILKNPKLEECNICSPVGSGKSTLFLALATVSVALYPKQLMLVGQSEQLTIDFLDLHIKPAMKKNKKIYSMWPKRSMDRKESIHFPTMSIYTGYATAINTLQSRSIDLLLCDEVWRYDDNIISEARARLHSRPAARMVNVSQGSFLGDEFHRNYQLGQIKKFAWQCPSCQSRNIYKFEDLVFDYEKNADETPIYHTIKAELKCPCCEHRIEDTIENRRTLSEGAIYVVEDENQNYIPNRVSYNFNQLSVYDVTWTQLAREFLTANASLNKAHAIRGFFQKKMGDFFDESKFSTFDLSDNIAGYQMDEFKDSPWDVRILTADVQATQIWIAIRDWTRQGKSRLVAYRFCSHLSEVEKIREEYGVKPKAVFIDTAHRESEVKIACCQYGWMGVNGREDRLYQVKNKSGKMVERVFSAPKNYPIKTPNGQKICQVAHYAGTSVKDILGTMMAKKDFWEIPCGGDNYDQYIHQLNSEKREISKTTGKAWYRKIREANHGYDVEVQQIIGAMIWNCLIFSEDEVKE